MNLEPLSVKIVLSITQRPSPPTPLKVSAEFASAVQEVCGGMEEGASNGGAAAGPEKSQEDEEDALDEALSAALDAEVLAAGAALSSTGDNAEGSFLVRDDFDDDCEGEGLENSDDEEDEDEDEEEEFDLVKYMLQR